MKQRTPPSWPFTALLMATTALCLLCAPMPAHSQEETEAEETVKGDPHGASDTWVQASPMIQAEQDPKLRPAATGGIFVPAMTDSLVEPRYVVIKDGNNIARTRAGRITYVSPGNYTVLVGSGVPENQLEFEASVVEGRITYIPVEWSGLVVNVVNERGNPFRGSYELVRLPDREYVGIGLGASLQEGETLDTWLLWPGKYMILAAGESYQARKNFTTLRLRPGELVRYTLVLDEETGELLGAGELSLAPETTSGWAVTLVLGGSLELNSSRDVAGKTSGERFSVSAFIETIGNYVSEDHFVYMRLNTELAGRILVPECPEGESCRGFFEQPFVTTVDELALDLLYAFRITEWFGPYVRSSVETNMLKGFLEFDEPTSVLRLDSDGTVEDTLVDALEAKVTEPFGLVDISAGTGLRFNFSFGYYLNLDARIGLGLRQIFARELFVADDNADTPEFEVVRVDDVTQFGTEGALILEFTPLRWFTLKLDSNALIPFDDLKGSLIDFRGTAILRLTSIASLNYTIRVREDRRVVDATQIDQTLLLRFAYKLF